MSSYQRDLECISVVVGYQAGLAGWLSSGGGLLRHQDPGHQAHSDPGRPL